MENFAHLIACGVALIINFVGFVTAKNLLGKTIVLIATIACAVAFCLSYYSILAGV